MQICCDRLEAAVSVHNMQTYKSTMKIERSYSHRGPRSWPERETVSGETPPATVQVCQLVCALKNMGHDNLRCISRCKQDAGADLLASGASVLATQHKGSRGSINAFSSRPPVAAQACQGEHHLLLVGHSSVMHWGACNASSSVSHRAVSGFQCG